MNLFKIFLKESFRATKPKFEKENCKLDFNIESFHERIVCSFRSKEKASNLFIQGALVRSLGYWHYFYVTLVLDIMHIHIVTLTRHCNTVGCQSPSSHLDIPKNDNGKFKKWKVFFLRNSAGEARLLKWIAFICDILYKIITTLIKFKAVIIRVIIMKQSLKWQINFAVFYFFI